MRCWPRYAPRCPRCGSASRSARSASSAFARGDIGAGSDVDVLVEFDVPVGLSSFVALDDALRAAAGRPVDLLSPAALKQRIGRHVLRDLVPL
jgi:predicted nucleotidyltransferase